MTWLRGIEGFVLSLVAGYFFDRQDLDKARKWMDRSTAAGPAGNVYTVATDAILYALEGRDTLAARRFTECLKIIDRPRFPNHEYLKVFCEFWLKTLDGRTLSHDLEALATEGAGLPTDKWLKRRFHIPAKETIQKNLVETSSESAFVTYDF